MATIVKPFTFSAGATIIASDHNSNFDTIYSDYNGNITNANISGSASIANAKLNLASISQAITLAGNLTLTGAANDFSAATISDLGTVTTADINGGTLDGMTLGTSSAVIVDAMTMSLGSPATGDIYFDNGSGVLTKLAKGTDGQFLKIGASIPEWDDVTATTQASASRQSGTSGINTSFLTLDSVAKTITSGSTVFVMCTLRRTLAAAGTTSSIKIIHGSTIIQLYTNIQEDYGGASNTDDAMFTLQGIVTGLSGSITFAVQGASSGNADTYDEINLTVMEF